MDQSRVLSADPSRAFERSDSDKEAVESIAEQGAHSGGRSGESSAGNFTLAAAFFVQQNERTILSGVDFHEHFVKHHSNRDLAKIVVYTRGRTPEALRDDILGRVKL